MKLSTKDIQKIIKNPEHTAIMADLIYVGKEHFTLSRKRNKEDFEYYHRDKPLTKEEQLNRIKNLVIPPAWNNVKIAEPLNGHLQVVGRDAKNRKVYRYHPLWSKLRNQTKFFKLAAFGNILPQIRAAVDKDLDLKGMPKRKVLALVLRIMEETHIRIGNDYYAKKNKTYGLSTLRTRHVETYKDKTKFEFVGKKGKEHSITLRNKKLARLVNRCEEIPGWELFQYVDDRGDKHSIDSGLINDYIHEVSGDMFSAKDFRTWGATKTFFETLHDIGYTPDSKENKSNILKGYDAAAEALGNTRTVCRKYYVHPQVVEAYETGTIVESFERLDKLKNTKKHFSQSEEVLLDMISNFKINLTTD
ncbi:DNA topoisomerase IB [Dokdonia sinensis]|uniref:DNA topoisomerase n=1 Tax=Dokdonia sinensis TaxID=2479847 RepID=A0A3M0FZ23_9FLAO|nr:DNA topoisomerase IB [Dokdonia sinensis]RMB57668.1 DNA topoisomerase IB [Dokdonia sinensis]